MAVEIRQLKVFLAVYEEGSLSRAALRLNAAQPGLSVRIQALEDELGLPLFERLPRGLAPTTAGTRLYEHGQRIIRDMNSAVQEIKALSGKITGSISVGIPPTLSRAILAPVLSEYTQRCPDVHVEIVEGYSTTLLAMLEKREVDMAFVTHVPGHPAVKLTPIYDDRFVLVSGRNLGLPLSAILDLSKPPHLKIAFPSRHHGLNKLLDEPFDTHQIIAERTIEIDGLAGELEFLAMSDWAGLLPFIAVHDLVNEGRLQINRIAGPDINVTYHIAHAVTEPLPTPATLFIEYADRELKRVAERWEMLTRS